MNRYFANLIAVISYITGSLAFSIGAAKVDLLRVCATMDRGFFATMRERKRINKQIDALIESGSSVEDPTSGLVGSDSYLHADSQVPLEGLWSLVYTDAFDVVSLASSPLTALRGIYFEIDRNGRKQQYH